MRRSSREISLIRRVVALLAVVPVLAVLDLCADFYESEPRLAAVVRPGLIAIALLIGTVWALSRETAIGEVWLAGWALVLVVYCLATRPGIFEWVDVLAVAYGLIVSITLVVE